MNEKQFLKQINSKANLDGKLTRTIVLYLISSQSEELSLQKRSKIKNIFRRIFPNYRRQKSAEQIIEDNFHEILEKTDDSFAHQLINELIEKPEFQNLIMDKLPIVMKKIIGTNEYDGYYDSYHDKKVFARILEFPKSKEYIQQNIDTILESVPVNRMFQVAQHLKGFSDDVDDKLNDLLKSNKVEIAKHLLEEDIRLRTSSFKKEELLDEYKSTISIMIDEMLESENCRYIDINYLSRGSYSSVYQIGNKVIKIGEPRETYFMPNHRRILQPLIRTNLLDEKNENRPFACVEISDKVDPLLAEDINDDMMYGIYAELRESGIICTDFKPANLGRTNKKNVPSLNGEEIDVAPNSVGFTTDKHENSVLNSGEIVIIDTDYIYRDGDPNIKWPKRGFAEKYERRYQQAQAAKITQKYRTQQQSLGKETKEEQREEGVSK